MFYYPISKLIAGLIIHFFVFSVTILSHLHMCENEKLFNSAFINLSNITFLVVYSL